MFATPHLQHYLHILVVATCATPMQLILSLSPAPVQAKGEVQEEGPVQDDDVSDGQGDEDSEQSDDDDEHHDQGMDEDDPSESVNDTSDSHGQSQDLGDGDKGGGENDDDQSQSQDVGDDERLSEMGECQPGSHGLCDSQETLVLPGRGEDPAPDAMEVDSPCSPSPAAQTDVESSSTSVHSISTPDRKTSWNEEFFTTPMCGNSGPRRAEIVEMRVALMQYFGSEHPDIMKPLS